MLCRNETDSMSDLNRRAWGGLLKLAAVLAALVFLPAWTIRYWQGWVCLLMFFVCATGITLDLMKNDPKLLERRMSAGVSAEKEKSQKIIQFLSTAVFIALFVLPVLDHRFGWSSVPAYVAVAGDALIALGFLVVFQVFKVNTFTSGIIEVAAEQKVISTGPYGLVRHPMYFGALILLVGIPIALGSWWGVLLVVPMTVVLVWRLLDEEIFLAKNLPGYVEYRQKVRHRLVPFVW
jgi:protein-S-isoprenylcysteine O-methyltransferase Ste14